MGNLHFDSILSCCVSQEQLVRWLHARHPNFRPALAPLRFSGADIPHHALMHIGSIDALGPTRDGEAPAPFHIVTVCLPSQKQCLRAKCDADNVTTPRHLATAILADFHRIQTEPSAIPSGLFIWHDGERLVRILLCTPDPVLGACANPSFRVRVCRSTSTLLSDMLQRCLARPWKSLQTLTDAFSNNAAQRLFCDDMVAWHQTVVQHLEQSAPDSTCPTLSCARDVTQLLIRLLFVWFLKQKPTPDKAPLVPPELFDSAALLQSGLRGNADEPVYTQRVLEPLFRFLSGQDDDTDSIPAVLRQRILFRHAGLFGQNTDPEKRPVWATLPDSLFWGTPLAKASDPSEPPSSRREGLFPFLARFAFNPEEQTDRDGDAAFDPEIIGMVLETLLARCPSLCGHQGDHPSHIDAAAASASARTRTGAWYTPRMIVDFMSAECLAHHLALQADSQEPLEPSALFRMIRTGELGDMSLTLAQRTRLLKALAAIRVLDPACGSGAFPVGIMQAWVRAWQALHGDTESLGTALAQFLQEGLCGTDIEPMAVEVTQMRCLLALIRYTALAQPKAKLSNDHAWPMLKRRFVAVNILVTPDMLEKQSPSDTVSMCFDPRTMLGSAHGFHLVIGNPPYVFARDSAAKGFHAVRKRFYYDHYALARFQINLYPLFIEAGTSLLAPDGILAFITPSNWLTIPRNAALREFVLAQSDVSICAFPKRIFAGAHVDTAVLRFRKSPPASNATVSLKSWHEGPRTVAAVPRNQITATDGAVIMIDPNRHDATIASILATIEAHAIALGDIATVKAGLQAYEVGRGSPPQTPAMRDERVYHARRARTGYVKYLDGQDVRRYHLAWSGEYLRYGPNLASARTMALFSGSRILVRQIPGTPPYCIHACHVTDVMLNDRNSMNVIALTRPYQLILAALNARVMSFWFLHRFGKLQRGIFPQFKVSELARFPIPRAFEPHADAIIATVNALEHARASDNADTTGYDDALDRMLGALYGLTDSQMDLIAASMPQSARRKTGTPRLTLRTGDAVRCRRTFR